jgi:tetratricopeptide (TPR) repeat protein
MRSSTETAVEDAAAVRDQVAGRSRSRSAGLLVAGGLVVGLLFTGIAALIPSERPAPPVAAAVGLREAPVSAFSVSQAIAGLQNRLKRLPGDYEGWAQLGADYVQQARITADPSYYPKAEQALARAAALAPGDFAGLTGQASLAAGRHEFAQAVLLARQAIAANPYGPIAYGILADASTQLGRYPDASRAVDAMMGLRPGVSSFTRASYDAELRGDVKRAGSYLEYALRDAYAPDDIAYCRYYLGELALRSGDLDGAQRLYEAALKADPGFVPAMAGRARATALAGHLGEAASAYQAVVNRLPLSQYVVEYGEVLGRLGRNPADQWVLIGAQRALMAANGVRDDLTWAEFQADHGSAAQAVKSARAEYARNPNLAAADALAWALHKAGRSGEALPYAKKATSTGWHNALLYHHRAIIEKSLGLNAAARRSAALVKSYNPRFDPKLPALARFS